MVTEKRLPEIEWRLVAPGRWGGLCYRCGAKLAEFWRALRSPQVEAMQLIPGYRLQDGEYVRTGTKATVYGLGQYRVGRRRLGVVTVDATGTPSRAPAAPTSQPNAWRDEHGDIHIEPTALPLDTAAMVHCHKRRCGARQWVARPRDAC